MRIGVDATCWDNNRGYGRQARALLRSLIRLDKNNEYTLFFDSPAMVHTPPDGCELVHTESDVPAAVAASAKGRRSLSDMLRTSRAMSARRSDVLLFPTVYTFVPVFTNARKIVFFHDVIAETFPQHTFATRGAQLFWNMKTALARWQADTVVTVSDYSKQCIARHFGMRPESIEVVGEAADPAFEVFERPAMTPALTACGIHADAQKIVYVGGFGAHKNLPALFQAFANIARREPSPEMQLVLVGEYRNEVFHTGANELRAEIQRSGLQNQVVFTGFLPDPEVAMLLNLATVLVLPSLMEGYGLPAVEAAACGCPVIATKESPLAGLLGGGVLSIEPTTGAIETALASVLQSESKRNQMREAGLRAARELTWDSAARQMMEVLNASALVNSAQKEVRVAGH